MRTTIHGTAAINVPHAVTDTDDPFDWTPGDTERLALPVATWVNVREHTATGERHADVVPLVPLPVLRDWFAARHANDRNGLWEVRWYEFPDMVAAVPVEDVIEPDADEDADPFDPLTAPSALTFPRLTALTDDVAAVGLHLIPLTEEATA